MTNTMRTLTPEWLILFKTEEEPRLRTWLADHGYTNRNADENTDRTPGPAREKPLPLNRINSLLIWNDWGRMSFTGASMIVTTLYAKANPDRVFSVEAFVERKGQKQLLP